MPELLDPTPELPDDTPTDRIRLPTRIRNVLAAERLKTVGEIREASDKMLIALPDLGRGSVAYLRKTLGQSVADSPTRSP
jgi:DNA-directed RNA polymerase alpha subunit